MKRGDVRRAMNVVVEQREYLLARWRNSMADLTDAQIDAAIERGKSARANEPRAFAARYDRKLGNLVVDLTNGSTFSFPPALAQGLEAATEDQLAEVEILARVMDCTGRGLRRRLVHPGPACRHLRDQSLHG